MLTRVMGWWTGTARDSRGRHGPGRQEPCREEEADSGHPWRHPEFLGERTSLSLLPQTAQVLETGRGHFPFLRRVLNVGREAVERYKYSSHKPLGPRLHGGVRPSLPQTKGATFAGEGLPLHLFRVELRRTSFVTCGSPGGALGLDPALQGKLPVCLGAGHRGPAA